ncbi:peptide chain release factor 2 [Vagococcus carniphilus]|uniref:Peptide chain release factor 2 n=1 Tax=Vagococcus carniphilus TaxID=218144 RepID=A0AAW8UB37_9ENTE|nr:peptide chain release factor 2 [Vagococcus carniphilus]MDT2815541.1 peptide chain release factor 2 [Vagococcus carniphilus]MDT2830825.1 peptide chain release factor 2 [Vagococcus carniphilus]MDT2834482.1 peptide chain release factor 2 [Vagococcus carniphilus]MDT2839403.1 peptide chain release factor 2 [Vagococcus carniphilus]MDT2848578.1 peptide chain release factor 2 [Vagococcus carniphilus]
MELSELKNELDDVISKIENFRGSLDLEDLEEQIAESESKMSNPSFWDDSTAAQAIIDQSNQLKAQYEQFNELVNDSEELTLLFEMVSEEEESDMKEELEENFLIFKKKIEEYELAQLLSEEYDQNNAIVELHPGAGGTESQDWGSMLLRMYTRWAESKGYKIETLDYQSGDEAGIKSVTLLIKGFNAFGYLKSERGVHRLVRISPFDSNSRRHTSFCSVDVMPELSDDISIDIKSDDLKVDTYRASGAGGQHINKTDSAVRITHLPTGVVVSSQAQRSQIKNREQAMSMLKAKLYQMEEEKKEQEAAAIRGEQKEIGWGSQIRSYVFHPYSMVKDHRTNFEVGNTQSVMDGEIDGFIDAYLRWKMSNV